MEIYSTKFHQIRSRYQTKRLSKKWKKHKLVNKALRRKGILQQREYAKKDYLNYEAPQKFSFINNTDEVLKYFNDISQFISRKQSVNLDIEEISELTPDTITLLMAKLNEKASRKVGLSGNAPKNPKLKKMFTESGLYDFVNSHGKKIASSDNKLWRHSTDSLVKGEMAGLATAVCRNLFAEHGIAYDTDSLYNLLVEAMSNTLHHAHKVSNINWWLYYYLDKETKTLKFSFIDLGVGIFKSASFDSYRNLIKSFTPGNQILVKPFLEGKIISSRETDKAISGKGVKQIMDCAKLAEFAKFIIITNDVKIDVKTQQSEQLSDNFAGTFIYFEISVTN
ncbi:hypothetical protein FNO01nite_29530 [Flavobacterium noncentrifugens]|uniref:Uncharacterized protein n=1 Tax=Flavobacterium noncentrifugens TaxID=1128970 RepID=A0A1G8Y271_9FLAO|nr:hypothetical protein [Flavobacterium noncentrifugens]GEP52281.1 hypothetical protein FNO01nite_29530 [Flavobacterium noncentrifugens]SDJ96886.1 hypothetical protein SAMN04487935_2162 [Flavobacterium noncentrifugens]